MSSAASFPPITFIHLTDLHIGDQGADPGLKSDTASRLAAVVATIQAMQPAPAFVLVSGDLSNRGDAASYRKLAGLMAPLPMPVLYAAGNHDERAALRAELRLPHAESGAQAPCHYDQVVAGVHVIVLDTSVPGQIGGALDDSQFGWLRQRLDAYPAMPRLLVAHHAPALDEADETGQWETLSLADTRRLRDLLRGHQVAGMFCGHIHYDRVSNWYGTMLAVATGLHHAKDILCQDHLSLVQGAGFAVCTLRPSGLTVEYAPLPATRQEVQAIDWARLRAKR
ncbi:metallophosphoesterase [Kerstersia similis]|uniref:metallophosphoesterase n=1 Tax=Kerstersia similis TaxID=206505 RepID=UPI0039EFAA20